MSGHISSYRVFRTDRPYALLPTRRWHDPDEPCPFPNSGPQPAAAPRRPDRRTQRHVRRRSVEPEVRSGMVANRWRPHPRCGRQGNCHRTDCASVSRHVARSVTRSRLVPAGSGSARTTRGQSCNDGENGQRTYKQIFHGSTPPRRIIRPISLLSQLLSQPMLATSQVIVYFIWARLVPCCQ